MYIEVTNKSICWNGSIKSMISIIIPVYNTDLYIEDCINSVLQQSYENYEILVVDDGSSEECRLYIDTLEKLDKRIKVIHHCENKGLFLARITGIEAAQGDYISFLDSDDRVDCDFYRLMVERAESERTDIVISSTVEYEDNFLHVKNLNQMIVTFEHLQDEDLQRQFWQQAGNCFAWHTVWNKIYSGKHIRFCLPYLKKMQKHLVMTEDIIFSCVFFLFAQKVSIVPNALYFYLHRPNNSTDANGMTLQKYSNAIHDLIISFGFVKGLLVDTKQPVWKQESFVSFYRLYARRWKNIIYLIGNESERKQAEQIFKTFCSEVIENKKGDYYYHEFKTSYNNKLELLKEEIINGNYEYISFDIFDTLITRPFSEPQELYRLMNKLFYQLNRTTSDFYNIRIVGELGCRQERGVSFPEYQDVTIDEIYNYIGKVYHIDTNVCAKLEQCEKELEIQFCERRETIKEVYDLAIQKGKKIIIISDMYLDTCTIEKMLMKNGYCGYEKLYVSSKERKVKWTGDLYRKVLNDLNVLPERVLHIGDNYDTDIKIARTLGINTYYVMRSVDLFNKYCLKPQQYWKFASYKDSRDTISIGYGCMQALAANMYFDNPFRSFCIESDYNMDPFLLGYHAVGMHLIGLNKWISEIVMKNKYRRVIFTSRDGYLPMKAYQVYREHHSELPEISYLYVSRKAILPYMLMCTMDFYDLPIAYSFHNPRTIIELLDFCVVDNANQIVINESLSLDDNFTNQLEYHRFITFFLEKLYDKKKHDRKKKILKQYFSGINEDDIIFDMGYSGRIQEAICIASGRCLDAMYIYGKKELRERERRNNFHIYSFYDMIPSGVDFFREFLLSDIEPSCIDYIEAAESVIEVFSDKKVNENEYFLISTIQRAAIKFVNEFYQKFQSFEDMIPYSAQEVSVPFEGVLRFLSQKDRHLFSICEGDDEVYSSRKNINLEDFLNRQYDELRASNSLYDRMEGGSNSFFDILKGRQLVFWGTGVICDRLLKNGCRNLVSFFIDNDIQKNGQLKDGKPIIHAETFNDWNGIFVVIANKYVDEITKQLENLSLKKYKDFICYIDIETAHIRRD